MRFGMIGGGEGAFIGAVHRMAARLDGQATLVCGSFSGDPARNRSSGASLGIDPARTYDDIAAMIAGERALPEGERMQALAIVTPNHLHAPAAIAALDAGFHVFSEKPMAMDLAEARAIAAAAQRSGRHYGLAFTYTGYPMIEEARARVAAGELGRIRLIQSTYSQGWLARPIDAGGNKQAEWRTDPARAGLGGCLGDIGTHAIHIAEHVSGCRVAQLSADLSIHVPGRRLDDDVSVLLRFDGGATGMVRASQVAAGDENGLVLRVHGETGGLEWAQMEPNTLILRWLDRPAEIVRAGGPGIAPTTAARLRTPAGHPEGYIEAFATLYAAFARTIANGGPAAPAGDPDWFPGVDDGVRTMAFVDAVVRNDAGTDKWTAVEPLPSTG